MALILRPGKTYTHKSLPVPAPYLVIDLNNGNKRTHEQLFTAEIYPCKAERHNPAQVLESVTYHVTCADWETFFSTAAIQVGDNQYARAYDYLTQIREIDPETQERTGALIWGDWESDEIAV